jgi:uncharacterized SAM-binding protein YcdF (DUF218 family)
MLLLLPNYMDTAFFIIAKLVGALLKAETWFMLALFVSFFSLLYQKQRIALWIIACTFVNVLALSIFPLGGSMLARIEATYPAKPTLDRVDGIIVLGGGGNLGEWRRWGQLELGEGADRYTSALALSRQHPEAVIVFTGGSGALRDALELEKSESELAQEFFAAQGIQAGRLILEGQSRNTAENAVLTLKLVQPKQDMKWVLITSAFHMPRAMRSFETSGWRNLTAYPVDYRTASFIDHTGWNFERNLRNLNILTRELIGQLAYRFTSR